MPTFHVVQRLASVVPRYDVTSRDQRYVVFGKVMTTTPKLSLHTCDGDTGPVLATMEGNFLQTVFNCFDDSGNTLCTLVFPALSLTKRFRLEVGDRVFSANGGVMGNVFTCKDSNDVAAFSVRRERSWRDAFEVGVADDLHPLAGILCSVAVYQHFNF